MTLCILQSEVQHPEWPYGGSTATLRIYSSQNFYSEPEGVEITAGQVGSSGWAYEYECTVNGDGNLVIPQVSLYATLDASPGTAKYTAVFFDSAGRKRNTKLSQFWISPYSVDMSNESSVEVTVAGTVAARGIYTYRGQNNGKGYYNLTSFADSTSNSAGVWTGSEWQITSDAGARLYYSTEDVDYIWQVTTWVADAGSAPLPSVEEYATIVTSTWQAVTLANQAYVPNYNIVNTTWSPEQIQQYVTSLVGDGTTPFASSLRCGKTFLDYDPDPSTNPVAISSTSPDWIAVTEEVVWLSGREYENDFADAVTGIGSTPTTLIVTESTAVTATVSLPATLNLMFMSGGKLNISSGQTVTIANMSPCGSQQIFTGSGNAVFAKNATNGEFNLSWWTGISDGTTDYTRAFTQAATSLTNNTGGTLFVGPGVWKMDGMTVPSGSWVIGSGQQTNLTNGTVIKPYSTSAVDLFTFSGGADRSGLRNLTVSTDGTVSSSSRCVRVVGAVGNTTFGITLDELHLQATLASSNPLHFDDSGSNLEMVDILINHPIIEVPANGTGIKWDSNNTLTTIIQPSIICAAGAKCYHVGEAGGGAGWIEVISGDERGPGSFASSVSTNRSITGSLVGATGVLTATTGAFVQNDVGQPFTRGSGTGYITSLIDATTANTTYSGADVANGALTMQRLTPSTSMAYCVWHIVGDHNTINIIGGADEGFQYFIINDAPTNVSPINVVGRNVQSTVSIEDPCVMTFRNCALKSQTFIDSAAVTGTLFFDGCSWDKTTINLVTGGAALIELDTPRVFGVHDGASIIYTDLSFHEGEQKQSIEVETEFLNRRDGATTPLATFASASETFQPAIRIGKLDPYTWELTHYYDLYRDDTTDGWLQIQGNQAAPFKGIATNCNIQTVASTFIGGVVTPAQITATQHNYNPGDSSYLVRVSANSTWSITGIGLTTTQRGGEIHEYVNVGSNDITFEHQNTGSTAGNRFICDTGDDLVLAQNERIFMTYDATTQRWRLSKWNITGVSRVGANLDIAAFLTATSADFSGNISVNGTTTLENALEANGTAQFDDTVTVNGAAVFTSTVTIGGVAPLVATDSLRSYLASTVTYNNNSTVANTALSVTVEAATKYQIQVVLFNTTAVKGLKMDFGGTSTQTSFVGLWLGYADNDPTLAVANRVLAAGTDFAPTTNFDGAVDNYYSFTGSMLTNGAGTFVVRGAQNAADASNTTINAGSYMILTKIS